MAQHSFNISLSPPLLQVRDLEVDFLSNQISTKAVNKISFELRKGETLAIVGESGSGKSVTALSLMQLIQSPPGHVSGGTALFQSPQFGEVDLLKLAPKQMQKTRGMDISMVFQEPMSSLNPVMRCGKQVAEVLRLHLPVSKKEAHTRTIELFQLVRLPEPERIFKSYPHELSGGQKQRVMIAMAMACNPSILIADEPTTALDVTVQARILELINELRLKNEMSVLFISHDLGVVAEIADRILVMYQGEIVEEGTVLDIFTKPQHPYTKGLLACRPALHNHISVLPTVADFMGVDEQGNLFEKEYKPGRSITKRVDNSSDEESFFGYKQDKKTLEEPLLRVENLQVSFPIRKSIFGTPKEFIKAVDRVSFDVHAGETIGIVGESGSGKTTLGRALLRLVEPTAGHILFGGADWATLEKEELRRRRKDFQMIFQDPYAALNPMMKVGDAIVEPMRVHRVLRSDRERKQRVLELLETVNLRPEHFNRYPHEFSGGQRQRICIARALALQPKCIICDESVSALDVSVQAQVLNLLNQLKREFNITLLFITHDLSVARFMSDRIFVMHKGQIVEQGTAQQVYEHPQQEYTRALLNAIPKGEITDILQAQEKRKAINSSID